MKVKRAYARQPIATSSNDSIAEAAAMMRRLRLPCLYVMEEGEGGRVAGIVTSQDLVLHALVQGGGPNAPVGTALRPVAATVTEDTEISEALAHMRRLGVTEILVTTEVGAPAGILSMHDVLDVVAYGVGGQVTLPEWRHIDGPGTTFGQSDHIPRPLVIACYVVIVAGLLLGLFRALQVAP